MKISLCISLLALALPVAAQNLRPWTQYRTILWMGAQAQKHQSDPHLRDRLRELGVNTGMVGPGGDPTTLTDAGFGHYVENMITKGLCLKFRSNVTNWSKFLDEWKVERSEQGLVRLYSFEDPVWRKEALRDMRNLVTHHAPFQPLAYDIRDELSVTISANPFDYDFSAVSLAGFREWLKTRYSSLEGLNAQWETKFATWNEVKPFTTDQIKHRIGTGETAPTTKVDWQAARSAKFDPDKARLEPARWNFSPWADHRTYMDLTLAKTLNDLREVARAIDPQTPVGIEGTQMPHAFGGYDLWRLSQVLDWVEPYDICNSREIFGSFMPGKPIMATVFEKDTLPAQRRLWHLLLEGDKGCIIWWSEDVIDWSKPGLPLTAKGKALAPVMKQLGSPLAQLLMRAERVRDPIALHYSQPSIQVAWLLESIADGATWPRRFSSFESDHNRHAMVRNDWLKAFQDLGFSPTFLASETLEKGVPQGMRALILPQSRAMSAKELSGASSFGLDKHHLTLSEGEHALFDERGRLRAVSLTDDGIKTVPLAGYAARRLKTENPNADLQALKELLEEQGLRPSIRVPVETKVRVHRFKAGAKARLLAFERNIEYKIREELAQVGGNEALEQAVTFKATWDSPGYVVNLRTGEKFGRRSEVEVQLDPWLPALFAILDDEPQGDVVNDLLKQVQ